MHTADACRLNVEIIVMIGMRVFILVDAVILKQTWKLVF